MTGSFAYTLHLEQPLIVTTESGDPNSAATKGYIPGTFIQGAFAHHLLQTSTDAIEDPSIDPFFRACILDGSVRFLHAYPCDVKGRRYMPMPLSFYQDKNVLPDDKQLIFNRVFEHSNNHPEIRFESCIDAFCLLQRAELFPRQTKTILHAHTRRNRQMGRAIGSEQAASSNMSDAGDLYVYESIAPNQQFVGYILSDLEDQLQSTLIDQLNQFFSSPLLLGRSRRSEYGGMAFRIDKTPIKFKPFESEVPKFDFVKELKVNQKFHITLLSDYIGRDYETGHNSLEAFKQDISKMWKGRSLRIIPEYSFIRAGIEGGFNSTWGMPLPQVHTLMAGSVISLKTSDSISQGEIQQLLWKGLGEKRNQGFGRITINWPQEKKYERNDCSELFVLDQNVDLPELTTDSKLLIVSMQKRILDRLLRENIVGRVLTICPAHVHAHSSSIAQLRLLLRSVQNQSLDSIKNTFKLCFDHTHDKKTGRQWRKIPIENKTLQTWLIDLFQNAQTSAIEFCRFIDSLSVIHSYSLLDYQEIITLFEDEKFCKKYVIFYADSLLHSLQKKAKSQ